MGLLPGVGAALKDIQIPEEELNKTESIIMSMSRKERENADSIDGSRRRRIARGAGVKPEDVAQLIKGFSNAREMAKKLSGLSMGSKMKMAQAMSQFDMTKLVPGQMPKLHSPTQDKSRLTPEQKRKLRQKRLRGK
jgi:signal recognition particle subunit SRP54